MPESTRSSPAEPPIWAVVLAGGVGSRFWPISRPARPKQILPLAGERPLIAETVARIEPLVSRDRLLILTGEALEETILAALPELGREHLLLEPRARGTAPVLTWAAHEIARRDPDAVMVSLHADHVISPASAFRELLSDLAQLAAERARLFTIGVEPTRPETGYGYIQVGERLGPAMEAYEVADFVEKPDRDTAHEYIRRRRYLWNSGIFVWRAATFLEEVEHCTPELGQLLPLLEKRDVDTFFERTPNLSVDEGVLERSERVAVARATFGWDDVGTWDAVGRTRAADETGNVVVGDSHAIECQNTLAWSEEGAIVVFGGEDLVVVRTQGVTFVAPRERTADLKSLLERLPDRLRRLDE